MPDTPGVMPVLAGAEDPGVVGAVGSWEAVALDTAVTMACAAMGRSSSGTDGTLGRTVLLGAWCCSDGWWACAPCPAGVPVALGDLAVLLGEDGVPDELVFPATSPARVGLTEWVLTVGTGVLGVLGDSVLARGISGSWCGSTAGAPGAPV
ncbi:hypothetical protein [Mycobacteroides abscessus]|uniref:hypothetical protein n=1 Tax=Mycobacteroides abscessus TaxID=36809 RepID=UPI001F357C09|nr:hypothetical protein [Mycobacteroides abscessus]